MVWKYPSMSKRGALLEVYESKVVGVNGKALDKTAKVTLSGGDEVVFSSPVRHAYVSFFIAHFFIWWIPYSFFLGLALIKELDLWIPYYFIWWIYLLLVNERCYLVRQELRSVNSIW